LTFIACSKQFHVKTRAACQRLKVFTIAIDVARQFRQDEIVPLKRLKPEIPESIREHDDEPAFVVLRHAGDRHEVNVDAVLLVERTAFAGKRNKRRLIGSSTLENVNIRGGPGQAIEFGDHESAETM
jgi:hypothetical protein